MRGRRRVGRDPVPAFDAELASCTVRGVVAFTSRPGPVFTFRPGDTAFRQLPPIPAALVSPSRDELHPYLWNDQALVLAPSHVFDPPLNGAAYLSATGSWRAVDAPPVGFDRLPPFGVTTLTDTYLYVAQATADGHARLFTYRPL